MIKLCRTLPFTGILKSAKVSSTTVVKSIKAKEIANGIIYQPFLKHSPVPKETDE